MNNLKPGQIVFIGFGILLLVGSIRLIYYAVKGYGTTMYSYKTKMTERPTFEQRRDLVINAILSLLAAIFFLAMGFDYFK